MSESKSPRDYGQQSPTEEYDPHYYEQHHQQQQQQNYQQADQEDLGPPASPDAAGSPDYTHEYADAPASPVPEGPQSPDIYGYSQVEQPESPENILQSPAQDDIHSPVQNDQISEADEPKSPDNGPHDYPEDGEEGPKSPVPAYEEDEGPKSPVEEEEGPKSPVQEYEEDEDPKSPIEEDEEGPKSPEQIGEDDSDNDNDNEKPAEVEQLMTNIFGEDSDDEDEQHLEEGDNEPRVVGYEDEEEGAGYEEEEKEWDFDRIMEEKKRERSKKRKRRKDGSIDLCSNADGQIRHVVELMKNAAGEDREANNQRRPAIQKTKMLEVVRNILLRADYLEALIENDMMSAISEWLAPLPDKSLPALEIRTTLLKILSSFPNLEPGVLKQSGLGKAVMLIFKHPKETRENKIMASKLIRNWSQPIFQISSDIASITKEERETFDLEHLPEAKRRKLEEQRNRSREAGSSRSTQAQKEEAVLQPGDVGYISRARVPKLSTSAYIIRPKNKIEGNFHGATKNRQNGRFDKAQREFKERTRSSKSERAIGVSIEGRRMD